MEVLRYFDLSGYALVNPTYPTVIAKSVNRGMKDALLDKSPSALALLSPFFTGGGE